MQPLTDDEIMRRAEALEADIKNSETYLEYIKARDIIRQRPELYSKVNEFRRKNYEIQNSKSSSDLFDAVETITANKDYNDFRKDPQVDSFLEAELALCRLMQDTCGIVVNGIDFELSDDSSGTSADECTEKTTGEHE